MADPENAGIAVGIALLTSLIVWELRSMHFIGVDRHLGFSTSVSSQFSRTVDACSICMADPKNIGKAVGIALLSSVETEIIVLPYPLAV